MSLVHAKVNFLAYKRGLEGSRKPTPDEQKATIGKAPKTTPTIRVTNEACQERILTELRTLDHTSKGKDGGKAYITCVFKCIDYNPIPPPKLDKKKAKSQPNRVQGVRFTQEDREENNKVEKEAGLDSESDEEVTLQLDPSRSIITKNQLDAKRRKEVKATTKELMRQKIFVKYKCKEPKCENKGACYYLINDSKLYYKVDLKVQNDQAGQINQGGDININKALVKFIRIYTEQ